MLVEYFLLTFPTEARNIYMPLNKDSSKNCDATISEEEGKVK